MCERGLSVDHTTIWRWVQRYAPEINKRIRPYLKMSGTSYRVDETYIKVGKQCKYLYRAVDLALDNRFRIVIEAGGSQRSYRSFKSLIFSSNI
jgi:transposase-like protein